MPAGNRTVTVNFEGITTGLTSAAARANASVSGLFVSIGNVGRRLATLGVLGGVAPALVGIGAAIKAMAGSILILPAAVTAMVAVFAVGKQAFAGFSSAISATSPAAFAAAARNMAPAMQTAVLAVRALEPNFIQLKEIIQQNFWTGFTTDINLLARTYFPLLNSQFGSISTGLHNMASATLKAFMTPQVIASFTTSLANVVKMLTNMSDSLAKFLTGFLQLSATGSAFLPQFGNWMAKISTEFMNWTVSGASAGSTITILRNSFAAFRGVGELFENVFGIIGAVLADLAGSKGQTGLSTIVAITGAVLAFVKSTAVSGPLSTIGAALRSIGTILVTVVSAGLQAIAPILVAMAPIVVALANAYGTVLLSAFAKLAPALAGLVTALGPILIPLLNAIAKVLSTVVIPILAVLVGWITTAVNALAGLFGGLKTTVSAASGLTSGALGGATTGTTAGSTSTPGAVGTGGTTTTSGGGGFFSHLISGIGSFFSGLFGGATGGGRAIGGPALAGQTYLVGERGPEMLSMGAHGFVTPNGTSGDTHIHVHIGDAELTSIISDVVASSNRTIARQVRQGRGLTV